MKLLRIGDHLIPEHRFQGLYYVEINDNEATTGMVEARWLQGSEVMGQVVARKQTYDGISSDELQELLDYARNNIGA